ADIAGIAGAVAVRVGLIGVGDGRAVVIAADAVAVHVRARWAGHAEAGQGVLGRRKERGPAARGQCGRRAAIASAAVAAVGARDGLRPLADVPALVVGAVP